MWLDSVVGTCILMVFIATPSISDSIGKYEEIKHFVSFFVSELLHWEVMKSENNESSCHTCKVL